METKWKKLGLELAGKVSNPASTLLWAIHANEKLEAQDAVEKAILGIFNKFKANGVLAATSVYDNNSDTAPGTPQLKHDLIIAIDGASERQLERLNAALPFKGEIKISDNTPSLVVHHEDKVTPDANHKTMHQASILLKGRYDKSATQIQAALQQITDEISSAKGTDGAHTAAVEASFAEQVAGTRRLLQVMR